LPLDLFIDELVLQLLRLLFLFLALLVLLFERLCKVVNVVLFQFLNG
jgi:hypothetical protein